MFLLVYNSLEPGHPLQKQKQLQPLESGLNYPPIFLFWIYMKLPFTHRSSTEICFAISFY